MDAFDRNQYINAFLRWLGFATPYQCPWHLTQERAEAVAEDYFDALLNINDRKAKYIIDQMREDIDALQQKRTEHGHLDKWKHCCQGIADCLLRLNATGGPNWINVAGAAYHLSGYVYHCIGFYKTFVAPAEAVSDAIWDKGVLQNEHTGGPVTLDPDNANNGLITIWNLAKGRRIRFERSDHEVQYLASRLLNFLCVANYGPVTAKGASVSYLEDSVHDASWAVDSPDVNVLTQHGYIESDCVLPFLQDHRFNRNETYNPSGSKRRRWFAEQWGTSSDQDTDPNTTRGGNSTATFESTGENAMHFNELGHEVPDEVAQRALELGCGSVKYVYQDGQFGDKMYPYASAGSEGRYKSTRFQSANYRSHKVTLSGNWVAFYSPTHGLGSHNRPVVPPERATDYKRLWEQAHAELATVTPHFAVRAGRSLPSVRLTCRRVGTK